MSASATPLRLDTAVCDRCGRCERVCTPHALRVGPGYLYVDWNRCDGCGRCADVCDRGAITLRVAAAERPAPAARRNGPASPSPAGRGAPAEPPAGAPRPRAHARAGARAEPPRPEKGPRAAAADAVSWTLPEALLVAVVAFALLIGVQSAVAALSGPPWTGIALLAYDGVLLVLLWFLARRRGLDPSTAYRLSHAPGTGSMAVALAVAVGCWLFSVTYRALVLTAGFTPPASEGMDLTSMFGPSPTAAVLTVAAIALIGPALEELLLRGVVLGAVRRRLGTWPAILISALLFAALHASLWSLLPLTVLGIGLGWLAARSRTLWPAVLAHVLYNGVLVAAAFYTAVR